MIKKQIILGLVGLALFSFGCGQAMLTHKLNALNENFEKRLQIKEALLPQFRIGEIYSFQFEVINGTSPYKWRIIQGTLPKGLTFEESTGKIFGTPQNTVDSPIVVMLTDSSGNPNNYIMQSFSLNLK